VGFSGGVTSEHGDRCLSGGSVTSVFVSTSTFGSLSAASAVTFLSAGTGGALAATRGTPSFLQNLVFKGYSDPHFGHTTPLAMVTALAWVASVACSTFAPHLVQNFVLSGNSLLHRLQIIIAISP
jgi:hypothetical protein